MKRLFFLLALFPLLLFAQSGSLTTLSRSAEFHLPEAEYIYIFLVDSTATADTAQVEIQNPINGDWIKIYTKTQWSSADADTVMVPGVKYVGQVFVPSIPYIHNGRIYMISGGKLYYSIQGRKK